MSSRPDANLLSLDEYVWYERQSEGRFEYFRGEIRAMSGASRGHITVMRNLGRVLDALAARGCHIYTSGMGVKTPSGLWTYPDVVLTCGNEEIVEPAETLANPILIAEVLSESTAEYDPGAKFEIYRSIPTLRDYLLIEQDSVAVEHRWRDGDDWRSAASTARDDVLNLTAVPFAIHVGDLFTGTATP